MILLAISLCGAGQIAELAQLRPLRRHGWDFFGLAVACDGGLIAVGARNDSDVGRSGNGAVYLYETDPQGTVRDAIRIVAGAGARTDTFGNALALSGDMLAVGNASDDDHARDAGSVHLFQRQHNGHWLELGEIRAPLPRAGDQFGFSVALLGNHLLVGAPYEDSAVLNTGAAYLYELLPSGSATLIARFRSRREDPGAQFGRSVTLTSGRAAIGSMDETVGTNLGAGAVYVFEEIGSRRWSDVARLTLGAPKAGDRFGFSIALDGDLLLIGAPHRDAHGVDNGSCYLFERNRLGGWQLRDAIFERTGYSQQWLGWSVALHGSRALLGAPGIEFSRSGKAVYCEISAERRLKKVEELGTDHPHFDEFGQAVAVSGSLLVIGAPGDDAWGYASGLAHLFTATPLAGDVSSISISQGGAQVLELNVGKKHAWLRYAIVGSSTGPAPGIPIPGGFVLPLRRDDYFLRTIRHPNFPPLDHSLGWLDGRGQASASFALPPGADPRLIGRSLQHVALVYDPSSGQAVFMSNPVVLNFEP